MESNRSFLLFFSVAEAVSTCLWVTFSNSDFIDNGYIENSWLFPVLLRDISILVFWMTNLSVTRFGSFGFV